MRKNIYGNKQTYQKERIKENYYNGEQKPFENKWMVQDI